MGDAEPGTLEGETMSALQAAIYARVSSEQQAEARTIASQVATSVTEALTPPAGVCASGSRTYLA